MPDHPPRRAPGPARWLRRSLAFALAALLAAAAFTSHREATPPAAEVWLPIQPYADIAWLESTGDGPSLTAEAAILIENRTGTVLYAKNPHEPRAPASTTKILTALLALEMGRLDDVATVSRKAASTPGSSARLYTGQKIRLIDLLHGLLLSSGNDAAVAVAEHIAGSESAFVDLMNRRAAELGATNSRFQNPHGLDAPGHFSTAYDLALLSRLALVYPVFGEIVRKRTYEYDQGAWSNTNQLLWRFEEVEGIKTGTTSQAGYCLVAAASRDGMQLISVVLGSDDRWADSIRLLEYGFENFRVVPLAEKGEVLARFPLPGGERPAVAVASQPVHLLVRREELGHISTQLNLSERLRAPIRRGQVVGTLDVYVGEERVRQVLLVSADEIRRRTPFHVLRDWLLSPFKRARSAPAPP